MCARAQIQRQGGESSKFSVIVKNMTQPTSAVHFRSLFIQVVESVVSRFSLFGFRFRAQQQRTSVTVWVGGWFGGISEGKI